MLTPFADSPEIRSFTEWRAALDAPDIDAVIIATPPTDRLVVCRAAVERGLPVLLEKPIAATFAECVRLADACMAGTVQVAHPSRHSWDLGQVRRRVQAGQIGPVCAVTVTSRARRYHAENSWYFDPVKGGGVVGESICNSVDLARWLASAEFRSITAEWVTVPMKPEFDHTVAIVGQLDNEAIVSLVSSFGGPHSAGLQQRIEIVGATGAIDFDISRHPVQYVADSTNDLIVGESPDREGEPFGALARQWKAFEDAAMGCGSVDPGLGEEMLTMAVVEAIRVSASTGRRVTLPAERDRR
jgi:predicted dehydrogenase